MVVHIVIVEADHKKQSWITQQVRTKARAVGPVAGAAGAAVRAARKAIVVIVTLIMPMIIMS